MNRTSTQLMAALASAALMALTASSARAQQNTTAGQSSTQTGPSDNTTSLESQARQTVTRLKQKNPQLKKLFRTSAGYAVFPTITEAAAIVGGSHGQGVVYQKGQPIGTATVTKGTVGTQLGGETYSELIFFQTADALTQFKQGNYQFTAGVNAVGANAGVGAELNYKNGVAVVTASQSGLMAKAEIGGQKFSYQPIAMGGSSSAGQSGVSTGSVSNNAADTNGISR